MTITRQHKGKTFTAVRPIYRVSDLATMCGVSRKAMRYMLKRHGVAIHLAGRGEPGIVYLSQLREGMPEVWDSIVLARAMSI